MNEEGTVTAVDVGEATIRATTNGKEATCKVTVTNEISKIEISNVPTKTEYVKDEDLDLTGLEIKLTYEDETTKIVKAPNSNIKVTGYDKTKLGTQTIKVTYLEKEAEFNVTVRNEITKIEITTSPTKTTYEKGEDLNLAGGKITATYENGETSEPIDLTNDSVEVTGYDKTELGEQILTVKYEGQETTMKVTVKSTLESISLDKTTNSIYKGENFTLKVTYNPTDTTDNKEITWTSSNTSVATVDSTGKVIGVGRGTATITATVTNTKGTENEIKATCTVTVKQHIESITLDRTEGTLIKGRTATLTATLNPTENDDDKKVTWSSSNENIATVDTQGRVTAIERGEATIKVTTSNEKIATCKVTVRNEITGIEVTTNPSKTTYEKGEDLNLADGKITAIYENGEKSTPIGMTNEKVEVTGYDNTKLGEQTLTVKYEGKETTIKVIVEEKPYFQVKGYTTKEAYILDVKPGTKISEFTKQIDTNIKYEIVDRGDKTINEESLIGTGMKMKLQDGSIYTIVTEADLNGDGIMDISDLGIVAACVAENANLENEYFLAGNLNNDNEIDISDLLIIANLITK